MSFPCLTLQECCLSNTHTLFYVIYLLYKCQSKAPTSFSLSWPIPYFLHLIFLTAFLLLLICTHHTQYMKSLPHLSLPIYATRLKMNSKLNYLVSSLGFVMYIIYYFKFLQGGYPNVHHPLLEEVKVKKTLLSFKGKRKKPPQTALASNCLWVAAGACCGAEPWSWQCHWSCLVVRGHRSQLPEGSCCWVFLWKCLQKGFLPRVSSIGSWDVPVGMRVSCAVCLVGL